MKNLYVRNVKKGFATNSSSYHSTLLRYIEVPKNIWVQFKDDNHSEVVNTCHGGYTTGIILKDDEYSAWSSYNKMLWAANGEIIVEDLPPIEGVEWVRIKFETTEED